MKLKQIKTKEDYYKYMKPYGEHVSHLFGDKYGVCKYESNHLFKRYCKIIEYKEGQQHFANSQIQELKMVPIETFLKLLNKELRKQKLKKICLE